MKRSEVNDYIRHAIRFFQSHNWLLPPFAFWTPEQWRQAGPEADEARACRLGWDVTDFCADRFEQFGNLLFTIRNGLPSGQGKPYAEKLMLVREGQHVPLHFHFKKTEDIINRGRGVLTVELYNSTKGNGCGDSAVRWDTNGCGDTFHGAYGLAVARGLTVTGAVVFASACGALKAGSSQGGWDALPTMSQAKRLLRERLSPGNPLLAMFSKLVG